MMANDLKEVKNGKALAAIDGWGDSWNWVCKFFRNLTGKGGIIVDRERGTIKIDEDAFYSPDGSVEITIEDDRVEISARYI